MLWFTPKNPPKLPVLIVVTPEMAREVLEYSASVEQITEDYLKNRFISPQHVAKFVRLILANEWDVHAGMVLLSDKGLVLEGQHRLTAIAQAGRQVEILVWFNCPPEAIKNAGVGVRPRTFRDLLSMQDTKNASTVAAICNLIYGVENGVEPPNHMELEAVYDRFKDDVDWALSFFNSTAAVRFTAPVMVAFVYCRSIHPRKVETLLRQLVTTVGREEGGAAIALDTAANKTEKGKYGWFRLTLMRKTFRAIQLHCEEKKVKKLIDTDEGVNWALKKHGAAGPGISALKTAA